MARNNVNTQNSDRNRRPLRTILNLLYISAIGQEYRPRRATSNKKVLRALKKTYSMTVRRMKRVFDRRVRYYLVLVCLSLSMLILGSCPVQWLDSIAPFKLYIDLLGKLKLIQALGLWFFSSLLSGGAFYFSICLLDLNTTIPQSAFGKLCLEIHLSHPGRTLFLDISIKDNIATLQGCGLLSKPQYAQ